MPARLASAKVNFIPLFVHLPEPFSQAADWESHSSLEICENNIFCLVCISIVMLLAIALCLLVTHFLAGEFPVHILFLFHWALHGFLIWKTYVSF